MVRPEIAWRGAVSDSNGTEWDASSLESGDLLNVRATRAPCHRNGTTWRATFEKLETSSSGFAGQRWTMVRNSWVIWNFLNTFACVRVPRDGTRMFQFWTSTSANPQLRYCGAGLCSPFAQQFGFLGHHFRWGYFQDWPDTKRLGSHCELQKLLPVYISAQMTLVMESQPDRTFVLTQRFLTLKWLSRFSWIQNVATSPN